MTALYPALLGPDFARLPAAVRAVHAGPGRWSGEAAIDAGRGPFAAVLARAFGFPPPGQGVPLTVTIRHVEGGEVWLRDFGGHLTVSQLARDPHRPRLAERFGPFTLSLALCPEDGALCVTVDGARLFGALPLPSALVPASRSRVWEDAEGRYRFDIAGYLPGGARLVRYRGWLCPDEAAKPLRHDAP